MTEPSELLKQLRSQTDNWQLFDDVAEVIRHNVNQYNELSDEERQHLTADLQEEVLQLIVSNEQENKNNKKETT